MLSLISTGLFIVVAVVNILPVMGVLGGAQLQSLYGVAINDSNLTLLMQHRAVLFFIIGGVLLYAAFDPSFRALATIVGLMSMMSFVILILVNGSHNEQLHRIFIIDIVASVALVIAYALTRLQ